MPRDGSVGHSAETAAKQADFSAHLRTYMLATMGAMKSWPRAFPRFVYFDLNAGKGIVNGEPGSPIIALRTARELHIPFRAFLFEKDAASCDELAAFLAEEGSYGAACEVVRGDHNETVDRVAYEMGGLRQEILGTVYADPNGMAIPVEPIRTLVTPRTMRHLDVLVYVSAVNGYKRPRGAGFTDRTVMGDLAAIGKSHMLIREPRRQEQWTFAFCTNWGKAPELRRNGFHRIDSPAGREIADRLEFTERERAERLTTLPLWGDPVPITSTLAASAGAVE